MMLQLLIVVETLGLFVALPLLSLYFKERVKNLAREATDKALADYTHQQHQRLETEKADHQRRLREFGLYAQKQHEAYAGLFKRIRIAADRFSGLVGFTMGPNFRKYDRTDISDYVKRRRLKDADAAEALAALEKGDHFAVERALNDLHFRANRRDAEDAFRLAKNYESLQELYFSDAVRAQLEHVRQHMARFSVELMRDDGKGNELEKRDLMEESVSRLFHIMRAELRRGESAPGTE